MSRKSGQKSPALQKAMSTEGMYAYSSSTRSSGDFTQSNFVSSLEFEKAANRRIFNLFDFDGSEMLDVQEIHSILRCFSINIDAAHLPAMLEDASETDGEELSFEEYLVEDKIHKENFRVQKIYPKYLNKSNRTKIYDLYSNFDHEFERL